MELQNIQKLCRDIFFSTFFNKSRETLSIKDKITQIFRLLKAYNDCDLFDLDNSNVPFMIECIYASLGKMLSTKNNFSLLDYLETIEKNDCHNLTFEEKHYCHSYHKEDLFTHLHLACFVSLAYAIKQKSDITSNELMIISGIALLHDIGKPGCVSLVKESSFVEFPFHREMGCGILQQLWSPNFGEPFTKDIWDIMCRTICVHMCEYHDYDNNNEATKYKWAMLAIENASVKQYLKYLSVGDYNSRIRGDDICIPDHARHMSSIEDFYKKITKKYTRDEIYNLNLIESVIIIVRGDNNSLTMQKLEFFLIKNKLKFEIFKFDDTKYLPDRSKIDLSLKNNNVTILDINFNSYFCHSTLFSNNLSNSLVLLIDTINKKNSELSKNMWSWIPPYLQNYLKELNLFSTSSISKNKKKSIPHICHVVFKNEYEEFGYDELFRQLDYFLVDDKNNMVKNESILDISFYNIPIIQFDQNILEYANYLYKNTSWGEMIDTIQKKRFIVSCPYNLHGTKYEKRIIKIKYVEFNNMWKPKWTRQCRGIILYLNDDDIIVPLKYQLQRGAEVLTNNHIKGNIVQTDDFEVNPDKILLFDDNQQHVISSLLNDTNINGVMSFKHDGSLLGVTYYFDEHKSLMKELINDYGDEFSKVIQNFAEQLDQVCVMSSQNTMFLGEDMQSYNVTAILNDVNFDSSAKPHEVMEIYGKDFMLKNSILVNKIKSKCKSPLCITLNYETVCENRTCKWGTIHTELAISYPKSSIKFLGASICYKNNVKFVPHFELDLENIKIEEPLYWKVEHTHQVNTLLDDLEYVINGKNTKEEFLTKNIPSNTHYDKNDDLDFEGFVFFTENIKKNSSNDDNYKEYGYNKIKTLAYYKSHLFKLKNVDYLLSIADTAGHIFPLASKVKTYFTNLSSKMFLFIDKILMELLKPIDNNIFYNELSEKAKISFQKQNNDKKCKMLINGQNQHKILNFLHSNFEELFDEIKIDDPLMAVLLKKIIMKIEPWNFICKGHIEVAVTNYCDNFNDNEELKELLFLCIK